MTPIRIVLVGGAILLAACGTADVADTTSSPASTSPPIRSEPDLLPPQEIPSRLSPMSVLWKTDFSKATVDLNEILPGIQASNPRDLIRPIDEPVFDDVSNSDWIADDDPGLALSLDDEHRFYPLTILSRHEIVNDTLGSTPVAVTFCPLCNTGIAFDRRFEGSVLRLGVSGLLRNSDLIMWDDKTESLWQQITGEAIVGDLAGKRLTIIPASIVRWGDFKSTYPDGQAMAPDQGFGVRYGTNPYAFYSTRDRPYAFFDGDMDDRYPALERVVGVNVGGVAKAYPFPEITTPRVVNDVVGGEPIVVFWGADTTRDALDSADLAEARAIGTGVAYHSVVEGRTLSFESLGDDSYRDIETGSTWTILGQAIDGDLKGSSLEVANHRNEFWFAWQAFFPDAEVYTAS